MQSKRFILSIFISLFTISVNGQQKVTDIISISRSDISIIGTSNVTDYTCRLHNTGDLKKLQVESTRTQNLIELNGAKINLNSNQFDCGNAIMNKDFKRAIQSQNHPYIEVVFLQFELQEDTPNAKEQHFVPCKIQIELAGVSKTYNGHIKTLSIASDRLTLEGELALHMSDFNIDPPKAMFGMVQASDEIKIGYSITFIME